MEFRIQNSKLRTPRCRAAGTADENKEPRTKNGETTVFRVGGGSSFFDLCSLSNSELQPRRLRHVGARHRRNRTGARDRNICGGAWHRPARSYRFADFNAPMSPWRYPRLLAADGRGDQPSPAGGRMAADPTRRIGNGRRTRPRPLPLPPAGCPARPVNAPSARVFAVRSRTARPIIAPSRSRWVGILHLGG